MSNQETPLKEQEEPLPEEYGEQSSTHEQEMKPPSATDVPVSEQYGRPPMPAPVVPPQQPPYARQGYYPGAPPQWAPRGQYGPYHPRRRNSGPWIVLTLLLLFLMIIGGGFFLWAVLGSNFVGIPNSVTETRNFSVSTNPTLVLNNDTGSIHVHAASSGSEVIIQATKHSGFGGSPNDARVSYTQDTAGNTVTVNVDSPSNFNFFRSTTVEFDVTVPTTATLQLHTNTGSVDVSGVNGQMSLTSNTGSIEVDNGMVSGTTQLFTNTGSITFRGSIGATGTYRFETNTGSVNVTLPSTSVFHVDASTNTGSINTNFPGVSVQHRQFTGADVHSDVGSSPQATVNLRTNTGSINLYQE